MPIETFMGRNDDGQWARLSDILRGTIITMMGRARNQRNVLAICQCCDELSGEVYYFPHSSFVTTPRLWVVDVEAYSEGNRVAFIGRGGCYERNIFTHSRHPARLVVQHIVAK